MGICMAQAIRRRVALWCWVNSGVYAIGPSFVIESIDADGQLENNTFTITTANFCLIRFGSNAAITDRANRFNSNTQCYRSGYGQV
jgi:hypothetical protein